MLGGQSLSYVNKHLRKALEARGVFSEQLLERIVHKGSLQHITELPEDLRRTFVTSMDISAEEHILMQAAFQRGCDNAISKTINFPNSATRDDILVGYLTAWAHGCKGCTVYRDGSRFEQVLNLNESKPAAEQKPVPAAAAETQQGKDVAAAVVGEKKKLVDTTDVHSQPLEENLVVGKKRRVYGVEPQACPDCQDTLVVQEGCCSCKSCGFSKCAL